MAHLKELLKDIECPAPKTFDPEIDDDDETRAKLTENSYKEFENDGYNVTFGSLRSRVDDKLRDDPRYHGEKVGRNDALGAEELSDSYEDFSGNEVAPENARELFRKHFESIGLQEGSSEEEDEVYSDDKSSIDDTSDQEINHFAEDNMRSDTEEEKYEESEDEDNIINNYEKEEKEEKTEDSFSEIKQTAVEIISERNKEDQEKGKAVKKQIDLWDRFLECRIRFQKALLKSNQLPAYDVLNAFRQAGGHAVHNAISDTYSALVELLEKLLTLQALLVKKNSNTKRLFVPEKKDRKSENDAEKTGSEIDSDDEDIPSDIGEENNSDMEKDKNDSLGSDEEEPEEITGSDTENADNEKKESRKRILTLDEYEKEVTKRFKGLTSFRDSAIEKWHEKTKISTGKISSKSFSAFDRSPLVQIKQILKDRDRLIRRSQLQRNVYHILGYEDSKPTDKGDNEQDVADLHLKNYHPEIFDDDDFYHQMLKELIERKSSVSSDDPIAIGRQWLEMQKLRTKTKKNVDTKASKGRKVRYNTHAKLVSFMAPVDICTMASENRDELFSSLFGDNKGFSADR